MGLPMSWNESSARVPEGLDLAGSLMNFNPSQGSLGRMRTRGSSFNMGKRVKASISEGDALKFDVTEKEDKGRMQLRKQGVF